MGAVMGLALGGAAVAGRAGIGRAGAAVADSEWAKKREAEGKFGATALRSTSKYLYKASFDARKGIIGGALKAASSVSGIDLGHGSNALTGNEGGFAGSRKKAVEKRQKRAEELKVGEDEKLTQDLHKAEDSHQDLLNKNNAGKGINAQRIETIDKKLVVARTNENDLRNKAANIDVNDAALVASKNAAIQAARISGNTAALALAQAMDTTDPAKLAEKEAAAKAYKEAANFLADLKGERSAIKNATTFTRSDRSVVDETANTHNGLTTAMGGLSINNMEDTIIPTAKNAIDAETRSRQRNYADNIPGNWTLKKFALKGGLMFLRGGDTHAARAEATHKIRMGAKLDSGAKSA
jgi:hypothetical protein